MNWAKLNRWAPIAAISLMVVLNFIHEKNKEKIKMPNYRDKVEKIIDEADEKKLEGKARDYYIAYNLPGMKLESITSSEEEIISVEDIFIKKIQTFINDPQLIVVSFRCKGENFYVKIEWGEAFKQTKTSLRILKEAVISHKNHWNNDGQG